MLIDAELDPWVLGTVCQLLLLAMLVELWRRILVPPVHLMDAVPARLLIDNRPRLATLFQ